MARGDSLYEVNTHLQIHTRTTANPAFQSQLEKCIIIQIILEIVSWQLRRVQEVLRDHDEPIERVQKPLLQRRFP